MRRIVVSRGSRDPRSKRPIAVGCTSVLIGKVVLRQTVLRAQVAESLTKGNARRARVLIEMVLHPPHARRWMPIGPERTGRERFGLVDFRTMRRLLVGFALLAITLTGCGGSTHHVAQGCRSAETSEHPLACEQRDECADPELAHVKLMTQAMQRVQEGRTPKVEGENTDERDKRAEEEIEAERASG